MLHGLHWWEISFYEPELEMTVKCEMVATSFDEALAKARKIDPRFFIGCVMGWREEQ